MAERLAVSTLGRRLSSITVAHRERGFDPPTTSERFRAVWTGLRRTYGTAQKGKAPLFVADVRCIVETLPDTAAGKRDRAMLTVGFAGAFRRSELVALDVQDLEDHSEGLIVTIRRSKTDQEGAGRRVGIPFGATDATCPVLAVHAWCDTAGIGDGALFRPVDRHDNVGPARLSDRAAAEIVKRSAARAGFDPGLYSGHSLRSGLATSAAAAGASERSIMATTGHRSVTVLRRYIREGSLFRENAAAAAAL